MVESIVAVTGLGGHAYGSWRYKPTGKMWLQNFFKEDLQRIRTMTYGYNSNLSSASVHTIRDYYSGLLNDIKRSRSSKEV